MLVTLPPVETPKKIKYSIDVINSDVVFDMHGKFNPNNLSWIVLNWKQCEINAIFAKLAEEYHATRKNG